MTEVSTKFKVYVNDYFYKSFDTLEDAQSCCDRLKELGYGDYWIDDPKKEAKNES